MPVSVVLNLPAYPSSQYRKNLSSSQLCSLYKTIASTLNNALSLPPQKRDNPSTRNYIATYARDAAFRTLQNLIWKDKTPIVQSVDEKLIFKRSLCLAEQLASTPHGLDMEILLDLSIIYARAHLSQLHAVFVAALTSTTNLPMSVANDLVPSFTLLLSRQSPSSQGLYGQRKVAECVYTFLRACKGSPEFIRPFAHNKEFILVLATLYDVGMTEIAVSYGGTPALLAGISAQGREPDDWERIWIETKVALIDSFHIVFSALLDDLASAPTGPRLAVEVERTFEIVFALLEQPTSASPASDAGIMPFLNRSLLDDYDRCYEVSKTLTSALKHAAERDERLDLLESMLKPSVPSSGLRQRDAGALKILLRSSGIQPGIDNLGTQTHNHKIDQVTWSIPSVASTKNKGKGRAAPPPTTVSDPDLDIKATQVLDILPDMSLNHIRLLLSHDKYGGNPEKVIEALLEGTAMNEGELEDGLGSSEQMLGGQAPMQDKAEEYDISRRKNVFDNEILDMSRLRVGKKDVRDEVRQDRSFIEQMKADILRRAEEISDDEDEGYPFPQFTSENKAKSKNKVTDDKQDILDSDYDVGHVKLRVGGDGEDTSEDDDDSEGEQEKQSPQTIIELAYLRDPALFGRDAATRRSKAREELRVQTGWADEQIEGWKVMLERTPGGKNKLEAEHAFTGNEKGLVVHPVDEGRGRGRGRGGSRGGRGRGRGSGGDTAQDRAWKDRNKAGRANHNRKRGHDKKMARAGVGPSNP